ncbi:2-methylcitrate dehydratase PrpD [Roseomonas rosea]|uniref:2-methylcitrate dehydratase PrpD n=1 Tax=Muricoccus roseus TaxID=198092 RepID=A0A1M6D745_9PROT|nr:MmgE/PrpD family protein [Roseomonas rosea]SHI69056.1 2-methylcitrate dehydratase PrpD [Roseomonas rosea]
MNDAAGTLTQRVASFAAGLTFEAIPPELVAKAKLHLLDLIGCGLAGADSTLSYQALAYLAAEHRGGLCPVLGTARRHGPAAAAFANSVAMNALDFDDGFEVDGRGMGHPGASLIAAAFSAPFLRATEGAAFLTALVAAYEINGRLIHAIQPSFERFRQVYGVCQHQGVGSAIAYGLLMGLDAVALENAVGLAATLSPLPSLRKYNWESRPLVSFKDFNAPAAEAGIRAVQMHAAGMTGSRDVLGGETGLWRMLGSDRFNPALLVEGLGSEWRMWNASLKPFPTCRWMHTALEGFADILRAEALAPEEIGRVTLYTSAGLARDFMQAAPETMVDAQFSFPFACAALAHGIAPAAQWYRAETMARPDLAAFARRVVAEVDPAIDAMMSGPLRRPAGRVSVEARGRVFASPLIAFPLGTRERPIGAEAVRRKFMENAAPVLGPGAAEALAEQLLGLERQADLARLLGGLALA